MPQEANSVYLRQIPKPDFFDKWFSLIAKVFGNERIQITFNFNMTAFDRTMGNVTGTGMADNGDVAALRKLVVGQRLLELKAASVKAERPSQELRISYRVDESTGFGLITVSASQDPVTATSNMLGAIGDAFDCMPWPAIVSTTIPQIQLDAIKLQEQTVAALAAEVSKVGKFALEQQNRFANFMLDTQKQLDDHRQRLEADDIRRRSEAEAAQKQRDEEHAKKVQALEEREREYQKKIQELNLKENTTERRNRMDGLTKWLEKEKTFKLSGDTSKLSAPIVQACWIAGGFGILLAVGLGVRLIISPDWKFVPGVSAGILLFVSTFVYYVRWSDRLFKEHARVEMRNRRLEADLQRAAWLSEMFFEVKEKDKQLPDAFVEHFARGLFDEEQLHDVEHPVEGLAKLAKNISSLKLGKDGVDIGLKPEK